MYFKSKLKIQYNHVIFLSLLKCIYFFIHLFTYVFIYLLIYLFYIFIYFFFKFIFFSIAHFRLFILMPLVLLLIL